MNWIAYVAVVVGAGVLASFTDWLFMGVLFHDRYLAHPEVWRVPGGSGEGGRIFWSQLGGLVSSAAFAWLAVQADMLTPLHSIECALLAWFAGPVVVIAQMVLWMKLHPLIGISHATGWLARFVLTGLLAAWLL